MTRASQDWVGKNVTGKTKSPTSDERWEGPGLINGGAAHPIRLVFWGEGNSPVIREHHIHAIRPERHFSQ